WPWTATSPRPGPCSGRTSTGRDLGLGRHVRGLVTSPVGPPVVRGGGAQHSRGLEQPGVTMALSTEDKKAVLAEYGLHETDTGSPEAQIAMLTKRISQLTEHLKTH